MAVTGIIHFGAEPLLAAHASCTIVDDTIQKAFEALKEVKKPQYIVFGTQIQDKGAVQIMIEWDGVQDYANFNNTLEFISFIRNLRSSCGEPHHIFHVALDRSAFGSERAATANVVEFVQSYFPVSRVTPEFQRQVDKDFSRFDEIYSKGTTGDVGWASGWVLEEQQHESIKDENAKCFLVIRGWESMYHFEQSVRSDAFRKAIPSLLAWKAPWKMWHVDRKLRDAFEVAA